MTRKMQIVKKAVKPRVEVMRCGSRITRLEWKAGVKKPIVTYSYDWTPQPLKMEYLERINRALED